MAFLRSFRTLLNLRTLLVAVLFAGVVFYYYSNRDWALEVPVTLEKRIDLVAHLEQAVPDYGFGNKRYYLRIHDDVAYDNQDDTNLYILSAPNSQFHFDQVRIHRNAVLKTGLGFYELFGDTPLLPVTFEIAWLEEGEEPGAEQVIFSREVAPRDRGKIKQISWIKCSMDDLSGAVGRLIFRCKSGKDNKYENMLCTWVNPRIDSNGRRVQLKKADMEREVLARDFIEDRSGFEVIFQGKGEAGGPVPWALGPGEKPLETEGAFFVDYGFIPASDVTADGGGARAALAMAADCTLQVAGVRVPEGEEVYLRFAVGLKELSCAAGGAEFRVLVDGKERFFERVEGGGASDRWRDRKVDLSDRAGDRVKLAFSVRFPAGNRKKVPVPPSNALRQNGEIPEVEALRPVAGFGHPVLAARVRTHRRFASKRRPNLIVVNIECLHSGYLGCYGSPLGLTPTMDALADEGVMFKDFTAASSWTLPSVGTLLTGVYPSVHGATRQDRSFLPNRFVTLPELFQSAGITTVAVVTNALLSRASNFDQGFERFISVPYQNARKVNMLLDDWLTSFSDFRFFAYLHFFEPHDPCNAPGGLRDRYVPPALRGRDAKEHKAAVRRLVAAMRGRPEGNPEEDAAYLKGRYFGEIRYMDMRLAELLQILEAHRLEGKTVVMVTGDHGEEFMEHGYLGHGSHLYHETVQVPLIVWGPREVVGPHRIVEGMADNASLYATAAALMGVSVPRDVPGGGLRPSLFPVDQAFQGGARYAYTETDKGIKDPTAERIEVKPLFALMDWRYTLLGDGKAWELYDRAEDPEEKRNLAGKGLGAEAELRRRLEGLRRGLERFRKDHYGTVMDARQRAVLQGLGYVGR